MNKKYSYGIIFTIIFTLSAVIPVLANTEYSFGIPSAAKGISVESEIKIYDKDKWENIVGTSVTPEDVFDGAADEARAKSKIKVVGWEEKSYDMLDDAKVKTSYDSLITLDTNLKALNTSFQGVAYVLGLSGYASIAALTSGNGTIFASAGLSKTELDALYDNNYKAFIIETDKWYYTTDDFKDNPDHEGKKDPIIKDPSDAFSIYTDIKAFETQSTVVLSTQGATLGALLNASAMIAMWDYDHRLAIDTTLGAGTSAALDYNVNLLLTAITASAGGTPLTKKYFALSKLCDGLAGMTPIKEYLDELIETVGEKDITRSGMVVNVVVKAGDFTEFGTAEEDFTIEFTYSDMGTQTIVVFKDEDGNEFFRKESISIIPIILLTVGILVVVAIIGISFVIKKKRS